MAKKQFKAESKRLLDLMINSIYTHKEIFLREIISNASDAIDKLCYVALTDDKVGMNRSDFAITVSVDKENRTLTVSDNGIGMSREELENNLGVIASSGSYKFRQETEEKDKKDADIDIIGQFGVGFYSAFMVADSITVRTKKYGSEQAYEWQSSGADGYTITECDKEAVAPTSSCTSSPTRTMSITANSWSPGGFRSWCASTPTISASPSAWRSPRPAARRAAPTTSRSTRRIRKRRR